MRKFILASITIFAFAFTGLCSITIAVLPYTVTYQGRTPDKMTPEQIEEAQIQDGEKFQTSMINYLTNQSKKRKYQFLDIHVIGQVQIDAMLRKQGLDTIASSLTDREIADAIGVTHVVRGSMTRNFLLTDGEAVGIGMISVLLGDTRRVVTSVITINHSVREAFVGASVCSIQASRTTTTIRPDQRAVRDTFRKASRRTLRTLKKND